MEEYGTVESIKIKEVRTERKKRRWFVFQWNGKQKNYHRNKVYEDCNGKVFRIVHNKYSSTKISNMKIKRNTTQTQKGKQKEI